MISELLSRPYIPVALGLLIIWWAYSRIREERKIQKLGGHAHRFKSWVPFGITFVWDGIRHALRDDNLHFWHKHFMTFGNPNAPYTLEAQTAGLRIVFTADPENIKAILATQFNDFGKGEEFNKDFHEFLGDSIFSTDGKKWHDSRQLIRPQFIKDRVSDLDCFERHSSILISMLGGQGQTVDLRALFFRFTLDAATDFLLGRSVGSLENRESEFARAFAKIQHEQNMIARAGPFKVLMSKRTLKRNVRTLNNFVEPFIDEALALPHEELEKRTRADQGYTFLHAIASYTRDRKVLRDQLVAVLLAGRDTTACTLSWLFWELARHPELVRDLRREIEEHVGFHRMPSYQNLKNMKTLQHTLNETLRLYPVVPFNVRSSLKDTTLPHGGGPNGDEPIGILKDTPIAYSPHYMQLTQDIYPPVSDDFPPPHLFAPHRWENWTPKHWTYIPFNGGPRICVGQNFALMEMGYTVTRILQRFTRIENRMDDIHTGLDEKGMMEDRGLRRDSANVSGANGERKGRWQRTNPEEPMLIERVVESKDRMVSEIVLQPGREVRVAFYDS